MKATSGNPASQPLRKAGGDSSQILTRAGGLSGTACAREACTTDWPLLPVLLSIKQRGDTHCTLFQMIRKFLEILDRSPKVLGERALAALFLGLHGLRAQSHIFPLLSFHLLSPLQNRLECRDFVFKDLQIVFAHNDFTPLFVAVFRVNIVVLGRRVVSAAATARQQKFA